MCEIPVNRKDIIEYLGADWDRMLDLIHTSLRSDVRLLEETNEDFLSNSGKQLRPMISLLVARAIGAATADSHSFAAASELLHNATLMHDDVADECNERRGRPTISALLGPTAAVLLGDYWLARAMDVILATERHAQVTRMFAGTLTDLAEGEMMQLEKASSCDTTEADYLRIIYCKTASLFAAAAEAAAVSVDASARQRQAARVFATEFGYAFQIKDDILDYAGTGVMGKPVGMDLRERKITLPLLGALLGAPNEAEIRSLVRGIPEHPESVERIRQFVEEREGIAYAVRSMEAHVQQAIRALDAFEDGFARQALAHIADYTIWRQT